MKGESMEKETSIDRAYRLIDEHEDTIHVLRGCELDIQQQISELEAELKKLDARIQKLLEELEWTRSYKMDEIYTKMALQMFINSGGGLDMLVD